MSLKKAKPLISIVTVVFNDLAGLRVTEKSIRVQSAENFEWVILDGGSDDGTLEYIESLSLAYLTWRSEQDRGIYDAMNKGVAICGGKYVVFLNAGDSFTDRHLLSNVSDHLESNEGKIDVLFGGANYCFSNGIVKYRGPKNVNTYLWHGLPANHQATYYRKARIPLPAYDLAYSMCGDYYLIATLFMAGIEVAYIDKPLVNFEIGGASFNHPLVLIGEAYSIQKNVLSVPIIFRILSLIKRTFSIIAGRTLHVLPS